MTTGGELMPDGRSSTTYPRATLLGLAAIVLWSTTIAFSRGMAERLGVFTGAAVAYLAAGMAGCAALAAQGQLVSVLRTTDRRYLWGCGGLMVLYTVLLYTAVGWAEDRAQIVAVTVANYLWPSLTLLFSIPLLGWRANGWLLCGGSALAITGVALTMEVSPALPGGIVSATSLLPTAAALAAAVAWGLYSTLSRRWAGSASRSAMPIFLLTTGLTLLALRQVTNEQPTWNWRGVAEACYVAIGPTLVAYTCWDVAARRGNLKVVAPASYLTPLLSVWISSLYLGISLGPQQWLATGLVVTGAVLCKAAVWK